MQGQETTASLSEEALFRRQVFYAGIIMGAFYFLVVCSAVVTFRKTKTIDIGPLEYQRSIGCFCCGKPCCCNEPERYSFISITGENTDDQLLDELDAEDKVKQILQAVGSDPVYPCLIKGRKCFLIFLNLVYVTSTLGIPLSTGNTVSCNAGFFKKLT